ncbi:MULTISPECIES: hypothetical protein [Spirosoma]|uniref:Uncharacterized protein n=1 Tax=Spirosoma liriopis TaxID=2937440 RepID=A0ABT0HP14_9BACT|nr:MULTISPECIES: hypothetical protein [Spirosoma]MCK8493295.1 hypothetical protein [Spirosoma liriopis]UHG92687.1 hypothetical protein LQ777_07220 [Spirosoma oryzicola]
MQRPSINQEANRNTPSAQSLQSLLSQSDDEFYGSLQRIWNNVVQLEDMGLIHDNNDKYMYAYRFAEVELQRAFSEKDVVFVASPIR